MVGLLIYALLLAGFVYVAFRPDWRSAYFAFFIFMRFSDVLRAEYGLPSLFMVVGPGLLLFALARWLYTGEGVGRGWRSALCMMLAYGAVCLSSLMYADDVARSGETLMDYLDGIVIVLAATAFIRTRQDFERALWALLVAGGLLASLAVFQQLSGSFEQSFGGFSRVEMRNIYDNSAGFRSEGPVSANYFALILIALVPLAVDRLLHDRRPRARMLAAAILASTLTCIVFTYSRGAVVALVVVGGAMLVWVPRRRIGRVLLATAIPLALAVVFVLPAEYVKRVVALGQVVSAGGGNAPQDSALRGRLSEMMSAAKMFGDHPIVGVGYGNFEIHYPRYAQAIGLDARREERQAHSLYLEIAAETGIVGLATFLLLIGWGLANVQRARVALEARGHHDTAHMATALGIALLGYLAGSVFLHLSFPRYFWLLCGLAYGCRELALQCREGGGPERVVLATGDAGLTDDVPAAPIDSVETDVPPSPAALAEGWA